MTLKEEERARRIRLLLAAYSYEVRSRAWLSDAEFDKLASEVDVSIETGRYDQWFRENFTPCTGMWVHNFPDLCDLENLYNKVLDT